MLKRAIANGFARSETSFICPRCQIRQAQQRLLAPPQHVTLLACGMKALPARRPYSSSAAKPSDQAGSTGLDPADEANLRNTLQSDPTRLPPKELVDKWKAAAERKYAAELDWPRYLKWRAASRSRAGTKSRKHRKLRRASRARKDVAAQATESQSAKGSAASSGNATEKQAKQNAEQESKHLTPEASVAEKDTGKDGPGLSEQSTTKSSAAASSVRSAKGRSKAARSTASGKRAARVQTLKEALLAARDKSEKHSEKLEKMEASLSQTLNVSELALQAINAPHPPVPRLSYGLDRVLFNPGVYLLRDARSRVFNFDPYLEKVIPVAEFDFNTLTAFMTPSTDATLANIASEQKKKYVGSTSSMTGVLKQFHFLLSRFRRLNFSMLSKSFPVSSDQMTVMTRSPDAVFLRWKDGVYAVDADKQYDSANVLSMMGKFMEKLLTIDKQSFEKHRVGQSHQLDATERDVPEAYHYSTMGDFVIRSQLDAYDPRLPGKGIFDLKTRAVLPVRMDTKDFHWGMDYEIKDLRGQWQSFEREFHDMARSTMLKYSLQVRLGRMDGIFVAYHNIRRIFGFQYMPLEEMDLVMHGTSDTTLGDRELLASLQLINNVFNKATERFPEQTIRFHFEARETSDPFLYIFAEPVSEEEVIRVQTANKKKIEDWEAEMLGRTKESSTTTTTTLHAGSEGDFEHATTSDIVPSKEVAGAPESDSVKTAGRLYSQKTEPDRVQAVDDTQVKNEGPLHAKAKENQLGSASSTENDRNNGKEAHSESSEAVSAAEGNIKENNSKQKGQLDTGSDAEVDFLEGLKSDAEKDDAVLPTTPLLAMIMHVKSSINGKKMAKAPEELKQSDKWELKYSMQEVTDNRRAWRLYEACKARRQKVYSEEEEDVAAGAGKQKSDHYIDMLKRIVEESKTYRRKLDSSDAGKDVRMWDDEKIH